MVSDRQSLHISVSSVYPEKTTPLPGHDITVLLIFEILLFHSKFLQRASEFPSCSTDLIENG